MTLAESGLLDTSTVILLPRIDRTALPARALISSITFAELTVGPLVAKNRADAAARLVHLLRAEALFDPLPFDAAAARAFGQVGASLRGQGRKRDARAFDALIAAIAIANQLPLYTCNPADFMGIQGLEVVAVPHPDRVASTKEDAHGDRS